MLEALQVLQQEYAFSVDVVDVDADEKLIAQYDELVPVLVAKKGDGQQVMLCHYFLDEIKVKSFLLDYPPC